jgi:DNA helicase IV
VDGIADEQRHVDVCYSRLDELTQHLQSRMASLGTEPGTGTGQDELEKQALFDNLVQQVTSARAAANRLCFGRLHLTNGESRHIGRIGLRDDAGEPLLLDWRAPQAAGFYQATSVEPMDIDRRRRIITRDRTVTHIEDEDLTNPVSTAQDAAADSVNAPREGRMSDIVATIAADQDRVVRSPLNQITVVQGGPGTGKTVVALHRAAWLLYTHREKLAKDGVLVVGPSTTFLRYIDQVLPSLGETDVVLLTPGQLYPPVSTSVIDDPEVAAVKGDIRMVKVITNAVNRRQRVPTSTVTITLEDGSTVRITADQLADARRSTQRNGSFHANREPFLRKVLDYLCRDRAVERREDPFDPDVVQDILVDLVEDANVRRTLNLMWLPTTPERIISGIFGDAELLRSVADGILSKEEQTLLLRPVDAPWTVDDVPLLDEAADRLGPWAPPTRGATPRDADDPEELSSDDGRTRTLDTLAERAVNDRDWIYGHVVVDEAQELSRMAWHALARRCSRKSMTIVGDLNQTTHPAGARSWEEALGWAREKLDLHTLTVTYRVTRQTAETATQRLLDAGGSAPELHPIRDGAPTRHIQGDIAEIAASILETSAREPGRVGVIVPDAQRAKWASDLTLISPRFGFGDDALDAPIAILTARDTKGLEFDEVFVIDPDAISAQARRGSDIYVACTRATQGLHLITLR